RDDLRHGFRSADECSQHLGGGLDVVERGAVGQPVVDQVVDDCLFAIGLVGAAVLDDRDEVLEVARPRVGDLHAAARLRQAARVHGGKYLGGKIDGQAEYFAHYRCRDDAAVLLRQVE